MNEVRKIELDNWTQFSLRRNSVCYVSSDGTRMLKTSSPSHRFTFEELQRDFETSEAAAELGIRTPAAHEIVMLPDGSFGAVYDYVPEKKSLSRLLSEDLSRMDEVAKLYAEQARALHTISADSSRLMSFENRLKDALGHSAQYTGEEKKVLLDAAFRRTGKTACLQGDFQPSNIIFSNQGCYFIDLGMLSYGDPLYDIGFLWYVVRMSNDRVYDRIFHTDREHVELFWQRFAGFYFETGDIAAVEKMIAPYGCLSINLMLSVMPNTGFIADHKEMIFRMIR